MSCGSIWRHWPRVVLTAGFHGRAFERSRRDSAQVAAPKNCDLGKEGKEEEVNEGGEGLKEDTAQRAMLTS